MHHNFEGVAKQLFSDQARNATFDNKTSNRYSQETKQFAMTLHYYSPKAYDFARKVLYLPHPSSIRSWSASVDCEPGFLCDVIKLIGDMVTQSDVVLIVDAMAIHKGTWWDPKKRSFVGNVDYGTAIPEASDELATEALVFLICETHIKMILLMRQMQWHNFHLHINTSNSKNKIQKETF